MLHNDSFLHIPHFISSHLISSLVGLTLACVSGFRLNFRVMHKHKSIHTQQIKFMISLCVFNVRWVMHGKSDLSSSQNVFCFQVSHLILSLWVRKIDKLSMKCERLVRGKQTQPEAKLLESARTALHWKVLHRCQADSHLSDVPIFNKNHTLQSTHSSHWSNRMCSASFGIGGEIKSDKWSSCQMVQFWDQSY